MCWCEWKGKSMESITNSKIYVNGCCAKHVVSMSSYFLAITHVWLQSRYPVILCEKLWCYLVFCFKYKCGSTDLYTSVAQEQLRLDALPDTTMICREFHMRVRDLSYERPMPYPLHHCHSYFLATTV